jgi:hypothetical protein
MIDVYNKERKAKNKDKRIIKAMLKTFEKKYGRYMIYFVVIELVNEQKIDFCRKMVKKIQSKIL